MKMNSDSTPSSEPKIGRTPPPNVIVPPGHIYMTVGDMPESFTHGVLMKAFADYSVALGRVKDGTTIWLGSGVLVRKGKHFGVLTAQRLALFHFPLAIFGSSRSQITNAGF